MRRDGTRFGIASLVLIAAAVVLGACVQPGLEDMAEESGSVLTERRADALSLVPADVALAIVVNDLASLDARAQELTTVAGLSLGERFVLDFVRDRLGGGSGIREDGALMVVYPDAASLIDDPQPAALVFVAVDDYRAFVGADDGALTGDELAEVRVFDEPWLARLVEGYAVLSPDAALLRAYVPAGGHGTSLRQVVAELGEQILERSQIAAIVNVSAWAPVLAPLVGEDAERFAEVANSDDVERADFTALVDLYGLAAETLLSDAQSVVFGANLQTGGVSIEAAVNLKPESLLASFVGLGGQSGGLFAELPSGDLWRAAAVDFAGIDVPAVRAWLLGAVPEGGRVHAFLADTLALASGLDGLVSARYWPEGSEPARARSVTLLQGETAPDLPLVVAGLLELVDGTDLHLPPISTEADTMVTAEGHWSASWQEVAQRPDNLEVARFEVVPSVPESYLEVAFEQDEAPRWLPQERSGLVAVADARGVVTMNDNHGSLDSVLEGPIEGVRVSDLPELAQLREWAIQEGPFFELYADTAGFIPPWAQRRREAWDPMAVYGHLAQHEVAGQVVLTIDTLSRWF